MSSKSLDLEVYYGVLPPWPNSTILESEHSTLLIDTQFMKTDARAVVERLKEIGKPLKAVFVTHFHPDHVWGGVEILKAFPDAVAYARPDVKQDIELDFRARQHRWTGVFNVAPFVDEMPEDLYPIEELPPGSFDFDGHEIQIIDLKPAETVNATGFYLPEGKIYIAGDQLYNKCHYYVGAGLNRPDLWAESLKDVQDRFDIEQVIPGHGYVGGQEIFEEAYEYLKYYEEVSGPFVPQKQIVDAMLAKYPDWVLEGVLYLTIGPAMTDKHLIEETGGHIKFGDQQIASGSYKAKLK